MHPVSGMTDKSTSGRPRSFDRDSIVSQALQAYWREGIRAVSVNELSRRTGASKPSLYRAFGSEDGLKRAVVDQYGATIVPFMVGLIEADAPFFETLERVIAQMMDPSPAPVGCLITDCRLVAAELGPATAAGVEAGVVELRDAYARWFARGQVEGALDATLSVELGTDFIDTQFTAVLQQMRQGVAPERVRAQVMLAFRAVRAG